MAQTPQVLNEAAVIRAFQILSPSHPDLLVAEVLDTVKLYLTATYQPQGLAQSGPVNSRAAILSQKIVDGYNREAGRTYDWPVVLGELVHSQVPEAAMSVEIDPMWPRVVVLQLPISGPTPADSEVVTYKPSVSNNLWFVRAPVGSKVLLTTIDEVATELLRLYQASKRKALRKT